MARITIEECWWTDPRRSALIRLLGGEDKADACAIRVWRLAQEFWKHEKRLVPIELFETLEHHAELLRTRLADVRESFVYVRGSSEYLDWVREQREIAKAAGKKSAESRRAKTGSAQPKRRTTPERPPNGHRTESNVAEPSVSVSDSVSGSSSDFGNLALASFEAQTPAGELKPGQLTWKAYKAAYEERYPGSEATWNAKVAGQLKNFVSRVPQAEAPSIAAFFLTHNDAFYVRAKHPVDLLLRDAEKLRTEWQTGDRSTAGEARQLDRRQTNVNAFGRLLDQAEGGQRVP